MDSIQELQTRIASTIIIGQQRVIERLVLGLLANGNLLLERFPGLAKTRAVKSMAKNLATQNPIEQEGTLHQRGRAAVKRLLVSPRCSTGRIIPRTGYRTAEGGLALDP